MTKIKKQSRESQALGRRYGRLRVLMVLNGGLCLTVCDCGCISRPSVYSVMDLETKTCGRHAGDPAFADADLPQEVKNAVLTREEIALLSALFWTAEFRFNKQAPFA